MDLQEIKDLIAGLSRDFEDFKKVNDKALAQKEEKGHVDAELQVKLDKINASLDQGQGELRKQLMDVEGKMDRIDREFVERSADRIEEKGFAARHGAVCSIYAKREIKVTVEDYRAYKSAQDVYWRQGLSHMTEGMRAAMEIGSDPKGGYLVTPDVSGRIVKLIYETSPIRRIAAHQSISGDALEGPRDLDEASFGWVGEKETRSETDTPEVGEYRIPCHELYAEPRAYQRHLSDTEFNVERWLMGKVTDKMVRGENTAFVTGNSIKKPRGFTDHTLSTSAPTASTYEVIQYVKSGANGAFASTKPGDKLIDLIHRLKPGYRQKAVWVGATLTMAEARKLKDGQGNYLLLLDFASDIFNGKLLGFPVLEAEDMPALATGSNSLNFGAFDPGYQIVDKPGISVLRDPYTTKGSVKFYTTRRVGGDVLDFDAIKAMKFSA